MAVWVTPPATASRVPVAARAAQVATGKQLKIWRRLGAQSPLVQDDRCAGSERATCKAAESGLQRKSPPIRQTADDTPVDGARTILATAGNVPLSIHFGAGRDDSHRFSSENLTTDFLARRNRSRTQTPDIYHR